MALKSLAHINIASKLMANPFFQEFPVELVEQLGPLVRFERIPSNSLILEQGKPNGHLYILNAGRVAVVVDGERVAHMENPGDLIGEMSVITSKPCSATILTETPVELITILAGDFSKVDGDISVMHGALYRTFAMILTDKLSRTNEKARRFEMTNRELQLAQGELRKSNQALEIKVAQRTQELAESNERMRQLLNNLDQGFVMINRKGEVEPLLTAAARSFFGNDLEGKKLSVLLGLQNREAEDALEWVQLGFSNQLPFDSVKDLGPKEFVRNGRYISLQYRPAYREMTGELDKIIIVATDKSEEVALKEKAQVEEELVKLAVNVMRDRSSFVDFVNEIRRIFVVSLDEIAKEPASLNLPALFRWMHTLKGGLANYHMVRLAKSAHAIEDRLTTISRSGGGGLGGPLADIQGMIERLRDEFENFLAENEKMFGRIDHETGRQRTYETRQFMEFAELIKLSPGGEYLYAKFIEEFVLEDISHGFYQFEDVVAGIAGRQDKHVHLSFEGHEVRVFLPHYKPLLASFVHLFRNAIDHGIELPDERTLNNKEEAGRIVVRFDKFINKGRPWVHIEVQDDGRGLNVERIREKCVEKKYLDQERAHSMPTQELIQYIFVAGFSTRESVNEFSGRGVGLDALKAEVQKLGGQVWVETELGQGSMFTIQVPLLKEIFHSPREAA